MIQAFRVATEDSLFVRMLRYLGQAWPHSVSGRLWAGSEAFWRAAPASSKVVGWLASASSEEEFWRRSWFGKTWSSIAGAVSRAFEWLAPVVEQGTGNSFLVERARAAWRFAQSAWYGSAFARLVLKATGIAEAGAPDAGAVLVGLYLAVVPFTPTTVNTAGAFALLAAWAASKLVSGDETPVSRTYIPVVLFAGITVAATAGSVTLRESLPSLVLWASYIAVFFVASQWIRKRGDAWFVALSWAVSATLVALLGIRQYFSGIETAESWVDIKMSDYITTRVYSIFDNPNMLAEYLSYAIVLAFVLLLASRSVLARVSMAGAAVPMVLCLGVTFSRGGWVATALGLLVVSAIKDRRFLVLLLIVLVASPLFLPESILLRAESLVTLGDSSAKYRITIWTSVLRMIKDRWATGIGLGPVAFARVYPQYEIAGTPAAHTHNLYLQILVEMGGAGLAFFVWAVLNHLRDAVAARDLDRYTSYVLVGAVAGTLGQLAHGLMDNIWYSPKNVMFFWAAIGMAVGMTAFGKKDATRA
ncbi:MAG: O-antigen ligase family protein [Bacillota bacterium]|nr:O-antigen ligase family protein [Bacillota bacterium]